MSTTVPQHKWTYSSDRVSDLEVLRLVLFMFQSVTLWYCTHWFVLIDFNGHFSRITIKKADAGGVVSRQTHLQVRSSVPSGCLTARSSALTYVRGQLFDLCTH